MERSAVITDSLACLIQSWFARCARNANRHSSAANMHSEAGNPQNSRWLGANVGSCRPTATKKGSSPTFPSNQLHFSKHSHVPCTGSPAAFSTLPNSRVSVRNASTDIPIRTVIGKFESKVSAAHCAVTSGKIWGHGSKIL